MNIYDYYNMQGLETTQATYYVLLLKAHIEPLLQRVEVDLVFWRHTTSNQRSLTQYIDYPAIWYSINQCSDRGFAALWN